MVVLKDVGAHADFGRQSDTVSNCGVGLTLIDISGPGDLTGGLEVNEPCQDLSCLRAMLADTQTVGYQYIH